MHLWNYLKREPLRFLYMLFVKIKIKKAFDER